MRALIGQCRTFTYLSSVTLVFPHHPWQFVTSPLGLMSHTHPTSASFSNYQLIFDDALKAYEKRTKKDLLTHPLAAQLQDCKSPNSILDVLQQQIQELNQSQRRHERWTRCLNLTVKVVYALSETLGGCVALVCLSL